MHGANEKPRCDAESVVEKCPGVATAGHLAPEFQQLIGAYHHRIWSGGNIPLKYKYLMALTTAVTGRERERALLETNKSLAYGASAAEIRETLELAVWLGGSPLLVEVVGPVLRFLEKRGASEASQNAPSGTP